MVRAQEVEEKGGSLPFFTDLTLSRSVPVASNLGVHYLINILFVGDGSGPGGWGEGGQPPILDRPHAQPQRPHGL